MRIVVTGCKGFIGSIFSKLAVERGHEVLGLDDESRGLNQLDHLGGNYVRHDCLGGIGEAVLQRFGQDAKVNAVVHLAAATGSLERPLDELRLWNVEMMQKVYLDAKRLGATAFIWPTTSLALGVPDSPYVMSKEEGLARLMELDKREQISLPVRFFNMNGAYKGLTELRKNEVHIIPTLFQCWKTAKPFTINGRDYETPDGTPSRDFVHVLDACEYLLWLIDRKVTGRQIFNHTDGAVWLGTGLSTTVLQVVRIFEQFAGKVETVMGPRRAFDCGGLSVNASQMQRFSSFRGALAPAWVSIRDEIEALEVAWQRQEWEQSTPVEVPR